jgi:mono/diheme cytochrome c family protein
MGPFMSAKHRFSRPAFAAAALVLLLGVALLSRIALAEDTTDYPAASLTAPTDLAALIARGRYLTIAGDCMPCHTGPGHAPFSGGLVINTPFGGLATPNITPDKTTGIGNWTDAQFYNALHYGVAPGSSYLVFPKFLYPGMPYTSYTKLSPADVTAIKTYLFSLAPVKVPPTPNTLNFPFSQRPVLLGWRILFFRAGPQHMNPNWTDAQKNGAYLTEALGHCAECHTPRNAMQGLIQSEAYAGSPIDAFFAPNISSSKQYGVGGWPQADLVAYLHNDGNMTKGSAFGPMAEVVNDSMSKIPVSDVVDIANYLQTQTKPQDTPPGPAAAGAPASTALGAQVYAANCASCHGQTGGGMNPIIPNLAGNDSVTAAQPYNVIGAVLTGLPPWRTGPAMPAFGTNLSDTQIAAVANYIRTSWRNAGTANATPHDVQALRAIAPMPPMADAASDAFGCPHVSSAGGPNSVTDPGNNLLNIYQGATPETLPNRTRILIAQLRAANSSISNADLTNTLVAAYCPIVAHEAGLSRADKQAALTNFIAGAQPLIAAKAN